MIRGRAIIDKSLETSGQKENNSSLKIKQNTGKKQSELLRDQKIHSRAIRECADRATGCKTLPSRKWNSSNRIQS